MTYYVIQRPVDGKYLAGICAEPFAYSSNALWADSVEDAMLLTREYADYAVRSYKECGRNRLVAIPQTVVAPTGA